jgi:outer membrane protein TolC
MKTLFRVIMQRTKKSFLLLFGLLIVIHFGTKAQTTNDSLKNYIHQAAINNPLVQSTYNDYLAALEKMPQVGSLPDPQLTMGYFLSPMELIGGNQRADIKLMQMFPWFGTLKAAKDEASKMALAKYEQFRQTGFETFYQVKKAWYDLYLIDKEITLVQNNLSFMNSLEQLALTNFGVASTGKGVSSNNAIRQIASGSSNNQSGGGMGSSGNMSSSQSSQGMSQSSTGMGGSSNSGDLADVLKVKMAIRDLESQLAFLQDQKSTQIIRFNSLLNRNPESLVSVPDTLDRALLPLKLAFGIDSVDKNNPMIRMFDAEQAAYAAKKRMVTKMGYPMFGVGLDYALIDKRVGNTSMMNGNDMVMPMLTITLPIYRNKYKSMIKEAELNRLSASQAKQNVTNDLQVKYSETLTSLNDAERRITLDKGQIDLAQRTVSLLITGFSTSGSKYDELLRMEQQLLDYRFKLVQAIVDQNSAVAMLENLVAHNEQ